MDAISVNVNYSGETHHLVGDELLSIVKKPIVLVNTARGGVVDEEAVILAIEKGDVAGYATDVVYGEAHREGINESKIISYSKNSDKVLITPHIGGVTYESWAKTEIFCAELFRQIFENE